MRNLRDILGDPPESGVYSAAEPPSTADLESLASLCMERGAAFFRVKGQGVDDKQQFLAAIAAALNFPDYFGNNWDALEDCLTDMSWHDAAGYVVLLDEMDCFAESRPDEFSIALEILQGVAEYWRSRGKHMAALVQVSRAQEWKLEPMGFDPESS